MLKIGDQIAGYVVVKHIGRGGFGDVWKIEKRTGLLVTEFALKLFELQDTRRISFAKIEKEIRISKRVSNQQHIISVIEADKYEDHFVYIISQYAEGGSLRKWLSRNGKKKRDVETAVKITSEILTGLENMHRKGIIHRDLKPENILKMAGSFCLADFGISREIKNHSRTSQRIGTPEYMPPEAYERKPSITVHTDIWAVGVILQELLTGKLPFPQEEPGPRLRAILMDEPEPMPETVPEHLRLIVKKALQKNRADRFESAADMYRALTEPLAEIDHSAESEKKRTIIDPEFEEPEAAESVFPEPVEEKVEEINRPDNGFREAVTEIISLSNPIGMEFVVIQPGTFLMGSAKESPVHKVTISQKFQMSKYPVTQGQWKIVMGRLPTKCDFGSWTGETLGDDKPVVCVSWADAQEFAAQLTLGEDGFVYRLPTEAEWEYACRAGSTGDYSGNLDSMAWHNGNSSARLHPVGKKQPNAWGLYDMHGNVWEWVQDWHWNYKNGAVIDPTGPNEGLTKVYRGGSCTNPAELCCSACRGSFHPATRDIYIGFRLVRTKA